MRARRRPDRSDGVDQRSLRAPALVPWIAAGMVAGCAIAVDEQHAGAVIDVGIITALVAAAVALLLGGDLASLRWRVVSPLLWLLAAAGAGASHRAATLHFHSPNDLGATSPEEPTLISIDGWLTADPVTSSPRRTTLSLESIADSSRRFDVEASAIPCALRAGELVRMRGWLRVDPPPRNPGELDASAWRLGRGVIGRVVVEDPALVTPLATFDGAASIWNRVRAALARGVRRSLPVETTAAVSDMLVAMNLGVTGSSMQPVRELFSRTGLSHFIVISGFHLAVLAATILLVAGWLGARSRLRGAIVLGASMLFLLVLESQVSVLRAGLGGMIAGAAMLLDRRWPAPSIVALVTIVILAVDPASAVSPAFQLSFGAVAALLLLSPTVSRVLQSLSDSVMVRTVRIWRRNEPGPAHPDGFARVLVGRIAVRPVAASLSAWIAVTPITLFHFGQCALWAIPASVILSPLASAIAVVGTVVAVVGCWSPALASPAGRLLGAMGDLFLSAVERCASLPLSTLFISRPPWWWACIAFMLPFAVVAVRRHRRFAAALLVAWIAFSSIPFWPRLAQEPSIVVLDLGLERCALVRAGRHSMLIDAGGGGAPGSGGAPGGADAGTARTIHRALLDLGTTHLDAILVTEHSLHSMGAVESLLRRIPVDRVVAVESVVDGAPNTAPGRMLDEARACGIPVVPLEPGSSIDLGGDRRSLTLSITAEDDRRPRRRIAVIVSDSASPPSLARALHDGLDRASAPGARRWRRNADGEWLSDRFDGRAWRPTPLAE